MRFEIEPKIGLGDFILGMNINQVLSLIKRNVYYYKNCKIISNKEKNTPIFLHLPSELITLRFNYYTQNLELIEKKILVENNIEKKQKISEINDDSEYYYKNKLFFVQNKNKEFYIIKYQNIAQLFGLSKVPKILNDKKNTFLEYSGIGFYFTNIPIDPEKNEDLDISADPSSVDTNSVLSKFFIFREDSLYDSLNKKNVFNNNNIIIKYDTKEPKSIIIQNLEDKNKGMIKIGDNIEDILRELKNPNYIYYCNSDNNDVYNQNKDSGDNLYNQTSNKIFYLNYFKYGLDILICNNKVNRIILHTNQIGDSKFGIYERCNFKLKLRKEYLNTLIDSENKIDDIKKENNIKNEIKNLQKKNSKENNLRKKSPKEKKEIKENNKDKDNDKEKTIQKKNSKKEIIENEKNNTNNEKMENNEKDKTKQKIKDNFSNNNKEILLDKKENKEKINNKSSEDIENKNEIENNENPMEKNKGENPKILKEDNNNNNKKEIEQKSEKVQEKDENNNNEKSKNNNQEKKNEETHDENIKLKKDDINIENKEKYNIKENPIDEPKEKNQEEEEKKEEEVLKEDENNIEKKNDEEKEKEKKEDEKNENEEEKKEEKNISKGQKEQENKEEKKTEEDEKEEENEKNQKEQEKKEEGKKEEENNEKENKEEEEKKEEEKKKEEKKEEEKKVEEKKEENDNKSKQQNNYSNKNNRRRRKKHGNPPKRKQIVSSDEEDENEEQKEEKDDKGKINKDDKNLIKNNRKEYLSVFPWTDFKEEFLSKIQYNKNLRHQKWDEGTSKVINCYFFNGLLFEIVDKNIIGTVIIY